MLLQKSRSPAGPLKHLQSGVSTESGDTFHLQILLLASFLFIIIGFVYMQKTWPPQATVYDFCLQTGPPIFPILNQSCCSASPHWLWILKVIPGIRFKSQGRESLVLPFIQSTIGRRPGRIRAWLLPQGLQIRSNGSSSSQEQGLVLGKNTIKKPKKNMCLLYVQLRLLFFQMLKVQSVLKGKEENFWYEKSSYFFHFTSTLP